ncbi:MAG: Magnesium transporter [Candidatus Daviesbacteria bacterium GW2011_GWA1_41_61]|uniref:Magnesium transporter n=1 Tax=Candidatus Daviesbacteria bacterium GW2011_GWA2_40_9 TaxID=1618424 RepID=A0A0G0X794_9BACT|nr:MAG: Magnesium transporter [Candidatus Daviesbacteria bacterium GW2011_GWC1_40_9]KKR83507.1 MAG: Magnesium transporter [Candidatus Daviesbacteria bacterium GW2011_GWA2_40_9]KKR93074.1 MAG: Magnesium transporter [Candidatus Daviesbacteria bacterium GW2011_GWB1_41_15]KKS15618.1 MAG: Magnesium transporter [Candidatus Daviesbacteria bacterium GW2011_GWA1_41_61]
MDKLINFAKETAGLLVTTNIPIARGDSHVAEVLKHLAQKDWDEVHIIYVLSEEGHLLGIIPLSKLLSARGHQILSLLMERPKAIVDPEVDQERVAAEAVKNDLQSIPVVDKHHHFYGVITAQKIIDVLHSEHLEDFLRFSGIRGKGFSLANLMNLGIWNLVKVRIPWLVVGLAIGLTASFVISLFEVSLRENIALVFFIPIIGYISDAVGTQTETIFIRSLTLLRFKILNYLFRELFVGGVIGSIIGLLSAVFAYLLSQSSSVALVVGLSLFLSISFATTLACVIPTVLNRLGKDPAVGSGPFTTAIQYLVSLTIYFTVATIIL